MGARAKWRGVLVANREFHYEKLVVSLRLSMSFITSFWGIG